MWTGRFFVRAIHEAGYKPVVVFPCVDNARIADKDYALAKEYTDKYDPVYLHEGDGFEKLVETLRAFGTVAVVCGCELGVPLADRLAKALGVAGNSPDTTPLRRDKSRMQDALQRHGIRHIRSTVIACVEEAIAFAKAIGKYPVVLKPLLSSGSEGLHFCRDQAELEKWTGRMLGQKNWSGGVNQQLLVQEYITGTEYIVDCVSRDGVHTMTDMWVYNKLAVGDCGICYDSIRLIRQPDDRCREMVAYIYQVLTALGFEYGPSHSELFWDASGPVLVETGARPMGGYMSENLLTEAVGHYLADTALAAYVAPDKFHVLLNKHYAPAKEMMEKYFITPRHEKLKSIPAMPLLRKLPSVREIRIRETIESYCTQETIDYFSSPGFVVLCHEDADVLMQDYQLIRHLEQNYPMLLFEGGGQGCCSVAMRDNPMVFHAVEAGYVYDGQGDVADLETAFSEFDKLIKTMKAGQCCLVTANGLRALGIDADAVKTALEILGLTATQGQDAAVLALTLL